MAPILACTIDASFYYHSKYHSSDLRTQNALIFSRCRGPIRLALVSNSLLTIYSKTIWNLQPPLGRSLRNRVYRWHKPTHIFRIDRRELQEARVGPWETPIVGMEAWDEVCTKEVWTNLLHKGQEVQSISRNLNRGNRESSYKRSIHSRDLGRPKA